MATADLTTGLLSTEEWRTIPPQFALDGAYEVSNYGRIRRLSGYDRLGRRLPHKILSPFGYTWGGFYIRLNDHRYLVYQLVAAAFLGPLPVGYTIRFSDGDRTNSRLSNLTYVRDEMTLVPHNALQEEWRPVANVFDPEGHYEVSNLGRARRRAWVDALGRPVRPRILFLHTVPRGYKTIQFGKRRYLLHQVVAHTFFGAPPLGHEVNHIDGNVSHNAATNLEYLTHAGNMHHASQAGLMRRGERTWNAILTEDDVRVIRAARGHINYRTLAQRYGVSSTCIYQIWNRNKWAWLD